VDACGAGATFSAGFAYGMLQSWGIEHSARFATAAASLKVTRAGLEMFPIDEIHAVAERLRVEYLAFRDNQFHKLGKLISVQQKVIVHKSRKFVKQASESLTPKKRATEKSRTQPRKRKP
jgi:bifunctional ADP-heptose synthase (sugar kinase/adenylyltransferase)